MADVLHSGWEIDSRQHELSIGGATIVAPPSPGGVSLTSVNALSSLKTPSHRSKRSPFEALAYRFKCSQNPAKDDTDSSRSYRPRRQNSISWPNNGLRYAKPLSTKGVPTTTTGYYSPGERPGPKSPMSPVRSTPPVTPPRPALKVSHFSRLTVTKTKEPTSDNLLASKSFKDFPALPTDVQRRVVDEDVRECHPKKKGNRHSHNQAVPIPITLNDVLLRSPRFAIMGNSRVECDKICGPVLGDLTRVDKHCGSQTTTLPLSDTPEGRTSRDIGSGSFTTSGYGGTAPRKGSAPAPGGSNSPQEQDQNELAVDTIENSPAVFFPCLPLICPYAARGYPCCRGKGYRSPEVRRLFNDHFSSKICPNNHLLYNECQRCKRLFVDKCSWEEHERQLHSSSPCSVLSSSELQSENYEPNRQGITEAHMKRVDKAIKQYSEHTTLPSQHEKWVTDNCKHYIGKSSTTTEEDARLELGKWLVAWYAIFPGVAIPSNPFMVNITHWDLLSLIFGDLIEQSMMNELPELSYEHCRIIAQICQEALSKWQLQQLEEAQSPKTKRKPAKRKTTVKRQPAKRQKSAVLIPTALQIEPVMGLTEPSVGSGRAPGLFPMASSTYTPSPYGGSSVIDGTLTDPTSYNDNAAPFNDDDISFNVPKEVENEDQSNPGGPGPSDLDFISLGSQHDGQVYSQEHLPDDPFFAPLGGIRALLEEWDANNPQ